MSVLSSHGILQKNNPGFDGKKTTYGYYQPLEFSLTIELENTGSSLKSGL